MTAEMPRTKPNIMMTARLLLMPVLRSVELKPPAPCANAETVLRRSIAATMSTELSRERTWGVSFLLSFIALMFVVSSMASGFSAESCPHNYQQRLQRRCITYTKCAACPWKWIGDEPEDRLDEARQTPGPGLPAAARNPRPVPCLAANYFRRPPRGTQSH